MNSKTLSSWLLMVGPIMFVLVGFILWEILIGEGETTKENVALLLENKTISSLVLTLGSLSFISIFVGYGLVAWGRAEGSTTSGTLASVASLIFVGIIAVAMAGTGSNWAIIGGGEQNLVESEWILATSDALFPAVFWFWSLGNIILGAALFIENKISRIASVFLIVVGAILLLLNLLDGSESDILDGVWMIGFFGTLISGIVLGFFNLKSAE
ncbi:MAG: hypothetical protein MK359_05000 [SAR202 cluster bacterium]|nr:hypothetical protein [SAR202 cluster bacterium]|tara:strand:- start:174 stop:812 length:639 start_codon:yes stop_codon:yes gene_type:complete